MRAVAKQTLGAATRVPLEFDETQEKPLYSCERPVSYTHLQLFRRCTTGVVNIDDENTEALLEGHTCKLVTYGCDEKADYRAGTYQLLRTHDFLGVRFHVSGKDDMDVRVNMPGEFSVYNALAALAVGKVLGLSLIHI